MLFPRFAGFAPRSSNAVNPANLAPAISTQLHYKSNYSPSP